MSVITFSRLKNNFDKFWYGDKRCHIMLLLFYLGADLILHRLDLHRDKIKLPPLSYRNMHRCSGRPGFELTTLSMKVELKLIYH